MSFRTVLILLTVPTLAGRSLAAAVPDIPPPARREASLALALRLSSPTPPPPVPSVLRDPFHPDSFAAAPSAHIAPGGSGGLAQEMSKLRTDTDILAYVSERITPSGLFVVNGSRILLIGKKKYKTGDRLTIDFDGHDIDLEITAIERSTFSLRLNGAEVTRPINQGKNP